MGAVKKTLGSKLLGCGGWLREKEESRARLWRSIHLGGCDNEFALNLKVELWSRQLIRSSDPLSWEWSLGVLKAHRITSPSGSIREAAPSGNPCLEIKFPFLVP